MKGNDNMLNKIENEVKELLKEKLTNYEGHVTYGADLSWDLLEVENCDGTITYDRQQAISWIGENFDLLEEVVEGIELNLGKESIPNVFSEPEKFMVVVYLEVAGGLLCECKYIGDNWNNEIELTREVVNTIVKQLDNL